jgi:hypothetical protein
LPEEEKMTVSESTLRVLGFNFEYFTHLYETKTGTTYHFCYEYGYLKQLAEGGAFEAIYQAVLVAQLIH